MLSASVAEVWYGKETNEVRKQLEEAARKEKDDDRRALGRAVERAMERGVQEAAETRMRTEEQTGRKAGAQGREGAKEDEARMGGDDKPQAWDLVRSTMLSSPAGPTAADEQPSHSPRPGRLASGDAALR